MNRLSIIYRMRITIQNGSLGPYGSRVEIGSAAMLVGLFWFSKTGSRPERTKEDVVVPIDLVDNTRRGSSAPLEPPPCGRIGKKGEQWAEGKKWKNSSLFRDRAITGMLDRNESLMPQQANAVRLMERLRPKWNDIRERETHQDFVDKLLLVE